jgi:hypothetical protein
MFGVADVHSDTTETYRIVGEGIATEIKKMPKELAKMAREAKSVGQSAIEKSKGFGSKLNEKAKESPQKARTSPEKLSAAAKDAQARGHSAFAKILQNQAQREQEVVKGPFDEDDDEGDSVLL